MSGKKGLWDKISAVEDELRQIRDMDLLLERILYSARKLVNADAGSIYLKEGTELKIHYAQNDSLQARLPPGKKYDYSIFTVKIDDSTISGHAANTGQIVNIRNAYRLPKGTPFRFNKSFDQKSGYRSQSVLAIPVKTRDGLRLIGVIQMINAKDETGKVTIFHKQDVEIVQHFALIAGDALELAWKDRMLILRMIKMAELRDPKETGPHVNRVAGYAAAIYERWAEKHCVPPEQAQHFKDLLRYASMLHDVGKVAISDVILKKPGRFTDEEFKVMQGHTTASVPIFIDVASEYDRLAQDVALTHHQNWDGSGYPDRKTILETGALDIDMNAEKPGLAGHEIPLAGRIASLADVYDALISRRVYKEPWSEEDVLKEIRSLTGTKFDPEIVEAFFESLPDIHRIRDRYPDKEE